MHATTTTNALLAVAQEAPEVGPGFLKSLLNPWVLLLTASIFFVAWIIIRVLRFLVHTLADRFPDHRFRLLRFLPITSIVVWTGAIALVVGGVFEPDSQTVAALVGASVFAVGFAAQDFFKNIMGGLIILFDRPFQVGDKVEIQPYYGEIERIGLRSTKLVTNDDNLVTVPNSKMLEQAVSNGNAGNMDFQVVTDVYLPAHVDVQRADELAWEAAATSPYVFLEKPIMVRITDEYKDRPLTRVRIKAYVLDIRLETLFQSDVSKRAKRAFMEAELLPTHFGAELEDVSSKTSVVVEAEPPRPGSALMLRPRDPDSAPPPEESP